MNESTANVKSSKTDAEFAQGLITTETSVKPDKTGLVTLEGALPQVIRKPVIDKTINGMRRVTY